MAPLDFIMCREADHQWTDEHALLLANCLAQRQTLLQGTSIDADRESMLAEGMPQDRAEWLARHRRHEGGRPSTLIVLPRLTPYALGALLALYEHKIFVQALVWGINPFDQWGVEAGKKMAHGTLQELQGTPSAWPMTCRPGIGFPSWLKIINSALQRHAFRIPRFRIPSWLPCLPFS